MYCWISGGLSKESGVFIFVVGNYFYLISNMSSEFYFNYDL